MAAQLNYNYDTAKGIPGGKAYIDFDKVVTRRNENEDGVMKFGMAVAAGASAGYGVKVPVAGTTAAQIDGEVLSIINKCYDDAMQLLIENRESLDKISEYLYEHETITGKEFMKIFREIKGIPEPEEESTKKSFMEQAMDAERQSKGNDGE